MDRFHPGGADQGRNILASRGFVGIANRKQI
jgi:hypothetical protein